MYTLKVNKAAELCRGRSTSGNHPYITVGPVGRIYAINDKPIDYYAAGHASKYLGTQSPCNPGESRIAGSTTFIRWFYIRPSLTVEDFRLEYID